MKLLELVFSASYYEAHFPGVVGLVDFGSSFEHYQIHAMPSCFPPSEYFEQHPEILKPDGIHCIIPDWQDVGFAHHKMIEEYLQYQHAHGKLPELVKTVQRHVNSDTDSLFDISLVLDGLVLKSLSQHSEYKITPK